MRRAAVVWWLASCLVLPVWGSTDIIPQLEKLERSYLPWQPRVELIAPLSAEIDRYPPDIQMRIRRLGCWTQPMSSQEALREAVHHTDLLIALARQQQDGRAEIEFTTCRGWFNQLSGEGALASNDYDQAIELAQQRQAHAEEAQALLRRGAMLSFRGYQANALKDLLLAYRLYDELGWQNRAQQVQLEMALCYRRMAQYEMAEELLTQVSKNFAEVDDVESHSTLYREFGMLYLDRGLYEDALHMLQQSRVYADEHGHKIESALSYLAESEVLLRQFKPEQAMSVLNLAGEILTPAVNPTLHAHWQLARARVEVARERPHDALQLLSRAEPVVNREENTQMLLWLYQSRSDALALLGEERAALDALRQYVVLERRLGEQQQSEQRNWMRSEFELTKQEAENQKLRAQQEVERKEREQVEERRFWRNVVILLCAVVAILLLVWLIDRNRRMRHLAFTDELTGIDNRRRIMWQGEALLELARRQHSPFSIILFDIDFFKKINDTLGHHQGDRVLQWVVQCSRSLLRRSDMIGRTGGEEFLILLPGSGLLDAERVADRVRAYVASRVLPGMNQAVTISLGCAELQPADHDLHALILRTDEALYRAKGNGRNRVERAE